MPRGVIAKVRKLMLVSMAVTVIAVGSVFGFIGYRIFKGEGTTAKTADKLPEASAIPTEMTLSLPRGARVIQSAVAADRLVITLEIDGKIEVRTFDVKTLQPAGRINFSGHALIAAAVRHACGLCGSRLFQALRSLRLAVRTRPSQG